MHAFIIASPKASSRQKTRNMLLEKYKIDKFNLITVFENEGSIENIRQIQKSLKYKLELGEYRMLLIESANKLSLEAQAAILKTIEEPPPQTIVVIETDNKNALLPTILSRSRVFEDFVYDKIAMDQEKILDSYWAKVLKTADVGSLLEFSSEIVGSSPDREQLEMWAREQIIYFRQILLAKASRELTPGKLTPLQVVKILKRLMFVRKNIHYNVNSKLLIDDFFLSLPEITSPASKGQPLRG